ncbi:hypothetical protein BSNK01_21210 [Bacillaceae bacterium]
MNLVAAEIRKLKRSRLLWLVVLLPLVLIFHGIQNFARYEHIWTRDDWTVILEQCFLLYPSLLYPLLIAVVMALIARIERSGNGWKHLLALPVRREQVYIVKFLIAVVLLAISMAMFATGIIFGGMMAGAEGNVPYRLIVEAVVLCFAASAPIMAVQYVLSIRFSHIGIPLAFGIGLSIPTILVANSDKYWIFDPWTYPAIATLGTLREEFDKSSMTMYGIALTLFLFVFLYGLTEFRRRDVQ